MDEISQERRLMPIRLAAHKRYKWQETDDGQPVGHVATFGGVAYLLTCPLCSCLHQTNLKFDTVGQTASYTPRCLLRQFAGQKREIGQTAPWQTIYRDWLKAHPKAADHDKICAVYIGKGSELPATYTGALPHAPAPTVQIAVVKRQAEVEKQRARDRCRQSKAKAAKDAA